MPGTFSPTNIPSRTPTVHSTSEPFGSSTLSPHTPNGGGSNAVVIGIVVGAMLVVACVGGFFIIRQNAARASSHSLSEPKVHSATKAETSRNVETGRQHQSSGVASHPPTAITHGGSVLVAADRNSAFSASYDRRSLPGARPHPCRPLDFKDQVRSVASGPLAADVARNDSPQQQQQQQQRNQHPEVRDVPSLDSKKHVRNATEVPLVPVVALSGNSQQLGQDRDRPQPEYEILVAQPMDADAIFDVSGLSRFADTVGHRIG
jgi:hypothetical protein